MKNGRQGKPLAQDLASGQPGLLTSGTNGKINRRPQGSAGSQGVGGMRKDSHGAVRPKGRLCHCLPSVSGLGIVRGHCACPMTLASSSGPQSWKPVRRSHAPHVEIQTSVPTGPRPRAMGAEVRCCSRLSLQRVHLRPLHEGSRKVCSLSHPHGRPSKVMRCVNFPSLSASLPWVPRPQIHPLSLSFASSWTRREAQADTGYIRLRGGFQLLCGAKGSH